MSKATEHYAKVHGLTKKHNRITGKDDAAKAYILERKLLRILQPLQDGLEAMKMAKKMGWTVNRILQVIDHQAYKLNVDQLGKALETHKEKGLAATLRFIFETPIHNGR